MTSVCARAAAAAAFVAIYLCGLSLGHAQNMGSIDAITAYQVLPAADMAQDVWSDTPTSYIPRGWARVDNWQAVFTAGLKAQGLSQSQINEQINQVAASGFYAAVYQGPSGPKGNPNIMIAFRSTDFAKPADIATDKDAALGFLPAQYTYAVQLVRAVQQHYQNQNATISLTGHSLGGGLASYAAENVSGVANVTTFNAVRPPIVIDSYNRATFGTYNQINVRVANDLVGDRNSGTLNSGYLPGNTYEVTSTTVNPGRAEYATHSLIGIIGGLEVAEKSSSGLQLEPAAAPPAATAPAQQQQDQKAQSGPLIPKKVATVRIGAAGAGANTQGSEVQQPKGPAPVLGPSTATKLSPKTATSAAGPQPRVSSAPTYIQPKSYAAPVTTFTHSTSALGAMAAVYRPGGISLSKAAAERMSLNINIEGLHYSNGQVLLAGHRDDKSSIDAALLLTALRTACEATEPYFSLDADNGPAWTEQSRQLMKAVCDMAKHDYTWTPNVPANRGPNARIPSGLTLRTLSLRRDFPDFWARMAPSYPDLKTRLVFRPEWLRQTRFGEIMYKADVLLKELTSGVSVVDPKSKLRAAGVEGYLPPLRRRVAEGLFAPNREVGLRQSRLWFDLVPQGADQMDVAPAALPTLDPSRRPELYAILSHQGFVGSRAPLPVHESSFHADDEDADLSGIYPTMFVRRHDYVTNQDIPGRDPYLSLLSADVNEHTERYVAAYKELRDLTEIFRAYVASVAIVRQDSSICPSLHSLPLYDAEKASSPLPELRPSEMFLDVVLYVAWNGNGRLLSVNSGTEVDGGVALRAKQFYEDSAIAIETQVMADLKHELALPPPAVAKAVWTGGSGREFILLNLRTDDELASTQWQPYTPVLASVGAPLSFRRAPNQGIRGEGYKSFNGSNYAQCEQLCLKEKSCVALQFEKSARACELFDVLGEMDTRQTTDVGIKGAMISH